MVQVQEQALAPVEKSETKKIVVNERCRGSQHDVNHAETDGTLCGDHFCSERRVTVHVAKVVGEGWVAAMNYVGPYRENDALDFQRFMDGTLLESSKTSSKEPQLRVWPKTAMLDPSTEEMISSMKTKTIECSGIGLLAAIAIEYVEIFIDRKASRRFGQFTAEFLVRIQTQNPVAGRFVDGRVFLCRKSLPFFDEDFRAKRLRDLDGAVGRAGIDDDDLAFAFGDEWLHARESASNVGFFVMRDDDDGKLHGERILVDGRWSLVVRQLLAGNENAGCEHPAVCF